jgi:serine/threonine protein kinase
VAVKKLKTEDLDIEDFKKEVSILSRTSHPNIVRFVGGCTRMPHLAIVTEFVARGNLCALLADPSVSFPWSLKIRIATDVAKGAFLSFPTTKHSLSSVQVCTTCIPGLPR